MKFQFVPSHKNIEGNELADLAANAAHSLDDAEIRVMVYKEDKVRNILKVVLDAWHDN